MDRLLKNKTPLLFYGNGTVPPLEDYGWSIICRNTADDTARILKNKEIELILVDAADFVPELKPVLDTVDTPLVFLVSDDNPELLQSVDGFDCSCVLDGASSPAVLDLSLRRLLKNNCRRYENEFENARIMLNDVLNTIPVRVFWKDLNSTYLGCNRLFALDSGKQSPEEIIGLTDYDIRSSETAEFNRLDDQKIIKSGEPRINYEEPFITPSGEQHWILTSKIPLRSSDGRMYGILGMFENITLRKQMEEEIVLQKNRLANILHGSNMGTWEWNIITGENIVNENWAAMLGYTLEELEAGVGTDWENFVHPDDLDMVSTTLERHFSDEIEHYDCEFRMRHKSGRWIWILSRGKVISRTGDGRPILVSGTHLDITPRKKALEEIKRQLSEKELILREVHHRMKNNFASVAGILSLHAAQVTDPGAEKAIQEAAGRLSSMEMLYRKLLATEDYRDVGLHDYLDDLIDNIISTFPDNLRITVEKDICNSRLLPKQLFPLGIIINELITDIMKYAFIGRDSGKIRISLRDDAGRMRLEIHDDGVGLPEDFRVEDTKGFGLMLVRILSQQLGGAFSIENSGGVKSIIVFDPI